ncbi:MAG: CPBP family intramembrane glutamic endopeptidase [Candidatus Krumholzibacteriota bacterium]
MDRNTFDLFALVTLLVLAVVVPLFGTWDFRRMLRKIEEGQANARTSFYIWTLIWEWGLVLIFVGYWIAAGRDMAPLSLVPVASGWQWLAIGLGIAATVPIIWQMTSIIGSPQKLAGFCDEVSCLIEMAPGSAREVRLFNAVAITAGVCEEILYRGVLLGILTPIVGTWQAVALSSVIFGLGHTYQGGSGIAKSALVGLVMALLTIFSGSLFVAMFLHATIDLTSGRILSAARLVKPELPDRELQTS